jgi:hypothetical protein
MKQRYKNKLSEPLPKGEGLNNGTELRVLKKSYLTAEHAKKTQSIKVKIL